MKTRHAAKPKIAPSRHKGGPRMHHREEDAETFFNPFRAAENPDWLVGAE